MAVRLDYAVVMRLLAERFKTGAYAVRMPSEPDPQGVRLWSRLAKVGARPVRRQSTSFEPDEAELTLTFYVMGTSDAADAEGDYAVFAVASDLMAVIDETPLLTDSPSTIEVELDRPEFEWQLSDALPQTGDVFAMVTARGRARRKSGSSLSLSPDAGTPEA